MRDIKFRAWDDYQKVMLDWNDCTDTMKLTLSNLLNGLIEHIKPMQYTGLKDKNGKEIYESDYLKYYYYPKNDYETGIVEYNIGSWWIRGDVLSSFGKLFEGNMPAWPPCLPDKLWEVIGNKYENPELL